MKFEYMEKYATSVEEHSIRVEAGPRGRVDCIEERMLA